jgi:uncharacterized protein YfaS (alpha-2-macroglobulin family)
MSKFIKGKDGKFNGSIGDGKDNVPQPSDLNVPRIGNADEVAADESSIESAYASFAARENTINIDEIDVPAARQALYNISEIAKKSAEGWRRTLDEVQRIHDETSAKLAVINARLAEMDAEEEQRAEENRGTKYEVLYTHVYRRQAERAAAQAAAAQAEQAEQAAAAPEKRSAAQTNFTIDTAANWLEKTGAIILPPKSSDE